MYNCAQITELEFNNPAEQEHNNEPIFKTEIC